MRHFHLVHRKKTLPLFSISYFSFFFKRGENFVKLEPDYLN